MQRNETRGNTGEILVLRNLPHLQRFLHTHWAVISIKLLINLHCLITGRYLQMFENLVKFRINCWAITLSDAEIHKDMYTW